MEISDKYLVVKTDDVRQYLTEEDQIRLKVLLFHIAHGRLSQDKALNKYLVVNRDEPYADKVLSLIKEHDDD